MYKTYKKDFPYSYAQGAFPVRELIETRPDLVRQILISDKYKDKDSLIKELDYKGLAYKIDDKSINRISKKGNIYVIGVFNKESRDIEEGRHILLDRPSDMGNLGTIIRTMVGLGYRDLILTGESCDPYDPKVIRASMGSFFKVRIRKMESVEAYVKAFKDNELYLFMLGEKSLMEVGSSKRPTLCFGNEGAGLDEEVKRFGQAVMIPQSEEVDSLNLPISTSIAMFYFNEFVK